MELEFAFDNVLSAVDPGHKDFVNQLHNELVGAKFKCIVNIKASGWFASYSHPVTKKAAFNFYFRKNGLHVRLYPKRGSGLVTLTDYMVSEIDKQPDCKKLTRTSDCSPYCAGGYEFDLLGKHYQKCKMSAFSFLATEESKPVILEWVKEKIIK